MLPALFSKMHSSPHQKGARMVQSFLVALMFGLVFAFPVGSALAQSTPSSGADTSAPAPSSTSAPSDTSAASGTSGADKAVSTVTSAVGSIFGWVVSVAALSPIATAAYVILVISSFLLWLGGGLFNWVILMTVFRFANNFANSAGMLVAWGILRDFGNIFLLFGFIFLGIGTILNLHDYNAKKSLARFIIFAVLLNFSLFVSEAIVDSANVLSTVLYSQVQSGCDVNSNTGIQSCANEGLSGVIFQTSGISTALNPIQGIAAYLTDPLHATITFIGLSVFMTVTAVVIFCAAALLITRAIVLAFLLIVSPVGFAGMAIPFMHKIAKQWWDELMCQSFFAPVYLLLMLISVKLVTGLSNQISNGAGLTQVLTTGDSSAVGTIMLFAVMIGFMIASLIVAKQFSCLGTATITKFGFGAAQYPFRTASGVLGRAFVAGGAVAGGKLYDAHAGRIQKWYGELKPTGPVGKAAKGAVGALAHFGDDAIADRVKQAKGAKFGSTESYESIREKHKKRDDELVAATKRSDLDEAVKEAKAAREAAATPNAPELLAANARVEKILQEMNQHERESTKYIKEGADGIEVLAELMSPENFAATMNSKDVKDSVKERLAATRHRKLIEAITAGNKDEVRAWSNKDLEMLAKYNQGEFQRLIETHQPDGAMLVSGDQADALAKSNELTNTQRQFVKGNTRTGAADRIASGEITSLRARNAVTGGPPVDLTLADLVGKMSAKEKAKLKDKTLARPEVTATLRVEDVREIMTKGEIEDAARDAIKAAINDRANPNYDKFQDWFKGNSTAKGVWGV